MTAQNTIKGDWHQLKGEVKKQWGKFTDNDIMEINGSKEKLIGKLMSTYSMSKDQACKEADRVWR